MMRLRNIGQKGVTLVEMLIVMGLLAVFLLIMTTIFTSTLDVQNQSNAYSATVSDGRFIMARLNYDIARASAVTTPASLGASGSSLVLTIGGNSYTYALSSSNLQLTDNLGAANLNGSGTAVSSLSFQRIGNTGGKDTIRYSFTLTSTTKHSGTADTQTFTSTAELR
ncbi:MAG: PulJ/GspJ family protein [Candidatus Saccharimonadales bacterium]